MKYDAKKDLTDVSRVSLQWHGEDTKVLIKGDAEKTEVKNGDVISVSLAQAKELLAYSYLWTLEGDKPLDHAYDKMIKGVRESAGDEVGAGVTSAKIDEMSKDEVVAKLKELGVSFNDRLGVKKLAELLKETLEAASLDGDGDSGDANTDESAGDEVGDAPDGTGQEPVIDEDSEEVDEDEE